MLDKKALVSLLNFLGISTLTAGSVGGGVKIYLRSFTSKLDTNLFAHSETFRNRTFLELIKSVGLTPIDDTTEESKVQLVLLHRLDSHITPFATKDNELFDGSKKIDIKKENKISGTAVTERGSSEPFEIHLWKKPQVRAHKKACQDALAKTYDSSASAEQLKKLARWCTVINNTEELLTRSGFTILDTETNKDDEVWKEVISGGWFTVSKDNSDFKYWNKQSFFTGNDLKTLLGESLNQEIKNKAQVASGHIDLFKNKCKASLAEAPVINNFPLSNFFRDGISEGTRNKYSVDNFYETAFFCVKPIKADDYIKTVLHGRTRASIPNEGATGNRICSLESTDPYDWYTNQPAEGRGFWCGVRELYAGHEKAK
ncbi:hypothetical protein [Candidatus Mycoplasma haematohominis]|uniref:hypothetical protein n=1 Tax=Candidatus Mycoplasma haematohominis TaxID=1494318 RepID=UPI001C0A723C|nr:hypothetical protein [Candidatus Mycoplasma haemohominis]